MRAALAWIRLALAPESMSRRDLLEAVRRPARRINRLASELIPAGNTSIRELAGLGRGLDERKAATWRRFVEAIEDGAQVAARGNSGLLLDLPLRRGGTGQGRPFPGLQAGQGRPVHTHRRPGGPASHRRLVRGPAELRDGAATPAEPGTLPAGGGDGHLRPPGEGTGVGPGDRVRGRPGPDAPCAGRGRGRGASGAPCGDHQMPPGGGGRGRAGKGVALRPGTHPEVPTGAGGRSHPPNRPAPGRAGGDGTRDPRGWSQVPGTCRGRRAIRRRPLRSVAGMAARGGSGERGGSLRSLHQPDLEGDRPTATPLGSRTPGSAGSRSPQARPIRTRGPRHRRLRRNRQSGLDG